MCIELPKADILISHDSIYRNIVDDAHTGLKCISKYIEEKKPFLNIHGHHHKQELYSYKDTNIVCVYKCAKITVKDNKVYVEHLF